MAVIAAIIRGGFMVGVTTGPLPKKHSLLIQVLSAAGIGFIVGVIISTCYSLKDSCFCSEETDMDPLLPTHRRQNLGSGAQLPADLGHPAQVPYQLANQSGAQ